MSRERGSGGPFPLESFIAGEPARIIVSYDRLLSDTAMRHPRLVYQQKIPEPRPPERGRVSMIIRLFSYDEFIISEHVIAHMRSEGYAPADAWAWWDTCEAFPGLDIQRAVVELDTTFSDRYKGTMVLCRRREDFLKPHAPSVPSARTRPELVLLPFQYGWQRGYAFVGIYRF